MARNPLSDLFSGGSGKLDPGQLLGLLQQLQQARGSAPAGAPAPSGEALREVLRVSFEQSPRGLAARNAWRTIGHGLLDLLRALGEEAPPRPGE